MSRITEEPNHVPSKTAQPKRHNLNPFYEPHVIPPPQNTNCSKTESFLKPEQKPFSTTNTNINPTNLPSTTQHPTKYQIPTEYAKTEVIEKINKIFLNNAQFSSLENDYFISQQKIINILIKS